MTTWRKLYAECYILYVTFNIHVRCNNSMLSIRNLHSVVLLWSHLNKG